MPPPPPPPAPPPPLPKTPLGGPNAQSKSNHSEPAPDRNALLSQIRKGARLKKVETNDRSSPLIEGNKSSNNASKQNTETNKPNGPFPIIPPGGLFAQGIPKLRPTTPRSDTNSNPPLAMVIQSIKQGNSNSSNLRVNQLSKSRSQPPSPVSKLRTPSQNVNSEISENSSMLGGNPNFPDDIAVKGPAPAPPPQSQKPVFKSTTNLESDSAVKHTTVKRSASQTNLQRPRLTRPPPSEKPPPPPKSNPAPPQNAPPPPPSKPPNIMRRQSFGLGESHSSRFASNKLSVANNNTAPKSNPPKVIGPPPPPPPPRNNSAPNDLNQMSSSPGSHCVKMNIAPPPPPNRAAAATAMRAGAVRPPPPRAPAPPPPPPPPQHQAPVHPAPPSQMKAVPSPHLAPPPPARVSSIKQPATDFEERFKHMFCSAQCLPKPEKFTNFQKTYPSRYEKKKTNTRRQPPPPPPQAGNRNNPVIPVQYDSGIYSGNYVHS